jgi:hypothetical protein
VIFRHPAHRGNDESRFLPLAIHPVFNVQAGVDDGHGTGWDEAPLDRLARYRHLLAYPHW